MSGHTPGPWIARGTAVYLPDVAGGFDVRYCPNAEANARLIAAAPELLEALERAEESLCLAESMLDMHQDDSPNFEPAILKARAAIAKAKGETT